MIVLRNTPMLIILLVIAALTTALSVAQLWVNFFAWGVFVKMVISLGLAGTMVSFLVAVEYDLPIAKSKGLLGGGLFLAVTLVIFIISQLWWAPVSDSVFAKLIITDIVLLGLVAFGIVAVEDFSSEKDLKDQKYIN